VPVFVPRYFCFTHWQGKTLDGLKVLQEWEKGAYATRAVAFSEYITPDGNVGDGSSEGSSEGGESSDDDHRCAPGGAFIAAVDPTNKPSADRDDGDDDTYQLSGSLSESDREVPTKVPVGQGKNPETPKRHNLKDKRKRAREMRKSPSGTGSSDFSA
jgi:hypothetical protein